MPQKTQAASVSVKGRTFRKAREHLSLPTAVAAQALRLTYVRLRRIEKRGLAFPAESSPGLVAILHLAKLLPQTNNDPRSGKTRTRKVRANLPFVHPKCPDCRMFLNVKSRALPSKARGRHWYFNCPNCDRSFWSNDGKPHAVNPKGYNWKPYRDRVTCPECNVKCTVGSSLSKKQKKRHWLCLKCGKRYKNIRGRAVLCTRFSYKQLPFLKDRNCPNCGRERLSIHGKPRKPLVRYWYFRCGNCDGSFRWNEKLRRLVALKRRKHHTRVRKVGRPKTGMSEKRKAQAIRLSGLRTKYRSLPKAAWEVYAPELQGEAERRGLHPGMDEYEEHVNRHRANERARQTLRDYRIAAASPP